MLNTADVKINTVQVEIKSLMVGKKQLTLSLMRQIIEEDLIEGKEPKLKGVPWGHVNYFWGNHKEKSYPEYMNIIWQKGSVLRRCVVEMRLCPWIDSERCEERERDRYSSELSMLIRNNQHVLSQDWVKEKIVTLEGRIERAQKRLDELQDYRLIFIPQYHELVQPLKSLEHFYIAV